MKQKIKPVKYLAVLLTLVLMAPIAQAAVTENVFGEQYPLTQAVTSAQAQVIYYRAGKPGPTTTPANIYVDQEFHTALLPGGYTSFCLTPGEHSVEAAQEDAPRYAAKQRQRPVRFEGGKTLFLRVSEAGKAEQVDPKQAGKELAQTRQQLHVLSRASSVKACEYKPRSYSLSSDVLFGFGKSSVADIDGKARKAISEMAYELWQYDSGDAALEVVGHTDRIGSDAANEALGLRRAQAFRQLLIEEGFPAQRITARSAGSRQPVTLHCTGNKSELIQCYAPDRRVVLQVQDK
ncbi:OmpA family protein [Pseudomonas chlororaphis]|uniref:OmpA family protein n=1 Tax=Pseudomonas chlororaphis subsp. aurantiaca TaxID=86192 RepID=A0AAJ0ZJ47_9PSED|nr:OmpA family protein [Pseudomonas chlororaphis]MBU4633449.1 OmpA family protein [Pseudomonas chlororaphis subsp. aurantiaca]